MNKTPLYLTTEALTEISNWNEDLNNKWVSPAHRAAYTLDKMEIMKGFEATLKKGDKPRLSKSAKIEAAIGLFEELRRMVGSEKKNEIVEMIERLNG